MPRGLRRPQWCGQPLRIVGLGRDDTLHGTYEFRSCPFPLGKPVSRKAGKTKGRYVFYWKGGEGVGRGFGGEGA